MTSLPNPTAEAAAAEPRTSRTRCGGWGRRALTGLAWLFTLGTLGLVGLSLAADGLLLAELVNSFQPVLFWLLVVSWLWLMVVRPRCSFSKAACSPGACQVSFGNWQKRGHTMLLVAVTIIAVWTAWRVFSVYLPTAQRPPGPQTLRVMSFNVLGTNLDDQAIMSEVRQVSPDLLIVWEVTYVMAKRLEALRDEYPYGLDRPHYNYTLGFSVFSKHPFTHQQVAWLPERMFSCPIPSMQVEIEGYPIRVLGIHASNPIYGSTWGARNRQLEWLTELVLASDLPTIVMGDFNTTPWSPNLRRFLADTRLRDTRQGQGLHNSWHASCLWLGVPIDHIFVSSDFHVHRRWLGNAQGSDHVPVICDLSIGPSP